MLTLFGSLLGFLSFAFPDFLKLWRDHADRRHKLAILGRQMADIASPWLSSGQASEDRHHVVYHQYPWQLEQGPYSSEFSLEWRLLCSCSRKRRRHRIYGSAHIPYNESAELRTEKTAQQGKLDQGAFHAQSWLYHGVDPNMSEKTGRDGERVIISFNMSQMGW